MHELVHDASDDVVDREALLAARELGLEDHLQEQVAQLFPQRRAVTRVDGVDDLARLLEDVLAKRLEGSAPGPRGNRPVASRRRMTPTRRTSVAPSWRASVGTGRGSDSSKGGSCSGPSAARFSHCYWAGYIASGECRPRPSPRRPRRLDSPTVRRAVLFAVLAGLLAFALRPARGPRSAASSRSCWPTRSTRSSTGSRHERSRGRSRRPS